MEYMVKYCVGIDLGGTTIKFGLFSITGRLLEKWHIDTNKAEQGSRIIPNIAAALKVKLDEYKIEPSEIKGIGIGIPGPVINAGFVPVCVNLGWVNVSVAEELKRRTGIPVKVENDANAAVMGEMWQGSGKGYKNLVMLTIGTGIGGGVVINEKIVSGRFGAAGEFGHMSVVPDETEICGCGRKGCLEQVASATGIVKEEVKLLANNTSHSVLRNSEALTALEIFNAAKDNDPLAVQVVEKAGKYLGIAMASITSALDPDVFILGGGVSGAGQYLIDVITRHYKENVFYVSSNTEIKLATLGNDAGIYGAARMIM